MGIRSQHRGHYGRKPLLSVYYPPRTSHGNQTEDPQLFLRGQFFHISDGGRFVDGIFFLFICIAFRPASARRIKLYGV